MLATIQDLAAAACWIVLAASCNDLHLADPRKVFLVGESGQHSNVEGLARMSVRLLPQYDVVYDPAPSRPDGRSAFDDSGKRSNARAMLQIFAQGDCDGSEVMIDPRFPDVGRPTFQDMRSLDEEFVIVRAWRRGRGQTA